MSAAVPVYGWIFMCWYWMISIIVTGNFQFMLIALSVEVKMLRAVIVGVISTRRHGSCSRERMRSRSCRKLWAICRFISFKNVNTSFDCLPRTTDSRFFALFYSAVYYYTTFPVFHIMFTTFIPLPTLTLVKISNKTANINVKWTLS